MKTSGFTTTELLIVIVILGVLTTLAIITINPFKRQVKTDDAAGAVFTLMRQARIQSITRRQFYGVVINTERVDRTVTLNNSTLPLTIPAQSISLIDMGSITQQNDEQLSLSKRLPDDIVVNAGAGLPATTAFPLPERSFPTFNFTTGPFVCYFDPAGRCVNRADGTGTQNYMTFYFSAPDIDVNKAPTLLRALTLYGATGGLKFWRFIPPSQWVNQLS